MILNMKGEVSSMASHIGAGEFWDLITVEDITSWMMHNPSTVSGGDYRKMRDTADILERMAALYSTSYVKRSGKPEKEIRAMMDKTTYLFGDEIVKAGFADEVLKTEIEKNKPAMTAALELKHKTLMQKISQSETLQYDYLKAVAQMEVMKTPPAPIIIRTETPATGGQNITQEVIMNIDELKKTNPELHAEILMAGKAQGEQAEHERVKSLIALKQKDEFKGLTMIQERIEKSITEKESLTDCQLALMAMLSSNSVQSHIESPGEVGGQVSMSSTGLDPKDAEKRKLNEEN
jgi:ATP-dependent protease ClpP protease subunit